MSKSQDAALHSASEGGVAGRHPDPVAPQLLVGTTTDDQFNVARLRLVPVACWRVDDIRFDFDSSFVTPDIATELQDLLELREAHEDLGGFPPLSVFGHADPEGPDDYNKALSGRRATVIYALLISTTDPGRAVSLWQAVAAHEHWGTNQRQTMQSQTGLPASTPDAQLFQAYMKALCPSELQLAKEDFLAQGADPGGKGDFQGCSRFNPLLIFSQEKETEFEQNQSETDVRNAANAPNRRVVVLLFRVGSKVVADKWPCPRATEGIAGCVKRFFSDGQKRRSTRLPDEDRKFEVSADTFACRFYQRLTTSSPCESNPQAPIVLARFVGSGNEHTKDVSLLVCNSQGDVTKTIPASDAPAGAVGFCVYRFDPRFFPNPVLLRWTTPDGQEHLAGPCDPVNLRDVLVQSELVVAEPLVEPEPDKATGSQRDTSGDSPVGDGADDSNDLFTEESAWRTLTGVMPSGPES